MVEYPGFSERIFEFAFNAEFAAAHAAVLAACPTLPSLQEEKTKGYDVEFELNRRGGGTYSLFLQHKVARCVSAKAVSNAHFFAFDKGPYFAFRLDIDQYNLIHAMANKGHSIYFCAPRFTSRRAIDDAYMHHCVCKESIWIDVKKASALTDSKAHTIIYTPGGTKAALFSEEPQALASLNPSAYQPSGDFYSKGFDVNEARKLYTDVFDAVQEWWPSGRRRPRHQDASEAELKSVAPPAEPPTPGERLDDNASRTTLIERTADLLRVWYGVTWLIIAKHAPDPPSAPQTTGVGS